MIRLFLLFFVSIFFTSIVIGQQSEKLSNSYLNLFENKNIFFNNNLINPTFLTDSTNYFIDAGAQIESISQENSNNGYFVSVESRLPQVKGSVGLNIDYRHLGYFNHRSFNISYKYNIEINNKTFFNFGFNVGVWQFKYDYDGFNTYIPFPIPIDEPVWYTSPLLDIGISFKYNTHKIGFSYNNLLYKNMELGNTDNYLRLNGFVVSYQNVFNINTKLKVYPEIYGCVDFKDNYGIATLKIAFLDFLNWGILYNTNKSFGVYFSGLIKKRFEIGYLYEIDNITEPQYNRAPFTLNFGFKL